jgi:hypothetical protein
MGLTDSIRLHPGHRPRAVSVDGLNKLLLNSTLEFALSSNTLLLLRSEVLTTDTHRMAIGEAVSRPQHGHIVILPSYPTGRLRVPFYNRRIGNIFFTR